MYKYETKKFDIPKLEGISEKQIEEHLKLYAGYVKHVSMLDEKIKKWVADGREDNSYIIQELWRRLSFEFNGMRNHEYYFGALVGGAKEFDGESSLGKSMVKHFDSFEGFKNVVKNVATTRGSGWTILYYDKRADNRNFIVGWIDEHHLGYLSSLDILLAIDMWEHAFMVDYLPGEKGKYLENYLNNINWQTVEKWYEEALK